MFANGAVCGEIDCLKIVNRITRNDRTSEIYRRVKFMPCMLLHDFEGIAPALHISEYSAPSSG